MSTRHATLDNGRAVSQQVRVSIEYLAASGWSRVPTRWAQAMLGLEEGVAVIGGLL